MRCLVTSKNVRTKNLAQKSLETEILKKVIFFSKNPTNEKIKKKLNFLHIFEFLSKNSNYDNFFSIGSLLSIQIYIKYMFSDFYKF